MNMPKWLQSLAESVCNVCVEDVEFGETQFGIRWAKPSADSDGAWVLDVNPQGLDPKVVDLLSLSRALEEVGRWRYDEGGPPTQPPYFLPRGAVGRQKVEIRLWLAALEEGEAHAVLEMKGKVGTPERGT